MSHVEGASIQLAELLETFLGMKTTLELIQTECDSYSKACLWNVCKSDINGFFNILAEFKNRCTVNMFGGPSACLVEVCRDLRPDLHCQLLGL